MTTSGLTNFSVSRDEIILEALEQLGVIDEGQTPTADKITSCVRTFNMLVKFWQSKKLNLFAVQKLYLFLDKSKTSYFIGSGGDKCATAYNVTTLNAAAYINDVAISVSSTAGISNGYNIGIVQDDGSIKWTTVNGALSGSIVYLSEALTYDSASGNVVYIYDSTKAAVRPMEILNAVLRDSSNYDIPIDIKARQDYVTITNKFTTGNPNQLYYDSQLTLGEVHLWPVPQDSTYVLVLWVQRTLEDFNASGDTPDFPQEWYAPLMWNLAVWIAPKEHVSLETIPDIVALAESTYRDASGFDNESYMQFVPDLR